MPYETLRLYSREDVPPGGYFSERAGRVVCPEEIALHNAQRPSARPLGTHNKSFLTHLLGTVSDIFVRVVKL
ncbi:hypothetical protein HY025_01145 [Candidatus Daviesbacteria bacterium]|nr:hypothetical protein [Candidatus Daviesbacteria bacterium]